MPLTIRRYASDPRQPRGSHSSQGSVNDKISRQNTLYTESTAADPDQRTGSRTSSQSSILRGAEAPAQSQTLPKSFGQKEPDDALEQGSSTMPRQSQKSRENSKLN